MRLFRLYNIFSKKHQIKTFLVFIFMFIGAFLETLSIGSVIPLFSVLFQPNFSLNEFLYDNVGIQIGNVNQIDLLKFLAGLIFMIFVIKNLYLLWFFHYQATFIFDIRKEFSKKIYKSYLERPYSFYLRRNTSQFIQIIQDETSQLVSNVLVPLLLLFSEILVFLSITILILVTIYWLNIIAVAIPIIGGAIVYFVVRNKLKEWGERRHFHETMRIKNIQQGFGGIKDIKIMHREKEFIEQFDFHNNQSAIYLRNNFVATNFPRLLFEVLGTLSIVIMVFSQSSRDNNIGNLILSLGLFSVALIRVAPSATRIMSALQKLRFGKVTVELILKELEDSQTLEGNEKFVQKREIKFRKDLQIRGLEFQYQESKRTTLSNINLKINKGSKVGIIGPSGIGKSTFVNILLGLLPPTKGVILADNVDIHENINSWQKNIGYVPQHIYLADDTLRRNIAFGLKDELIDDELIKKVTIMANLEEMTANLDKGVETIIGERGARLSGGQQQRIGLARALYGNPSLLVLDEATSSLDTKSEKVVLNSVYSLDKSITVVMIAHRQNTLENCDVVYEISKFDMKII